MSAFSFDYITAFDISTFSIPSLYFDLTLLWLILALPQCISCSVRVFFFQLVYLNCIRFDLIWNSVQIAGKYNFVCGCKLHGRSCYHTQTHMLIPCKYEKTVTKRHVYCFFYWTNGNHSRQFYHLSMCSPLLQSFFCRSHAVYCSGCFDMCVAVLRLGIFWSVSQFP